MKNITSSPKSMQNSIWSSEITKKKVNRWEFKRHTPNRLTTIGFVKKVPTGFSFLGVTHPDFATVKSVAADAGYNKLKMGAVVAKL